ncbi:hypothetical protein [Riemerella anatipestifer]|uniref:hypothetical protein n=1 Tax=Riemerella anatipestifer TaxID=34085 RepID=UPI0021D5D2A3|nr:hypothetical protein [Riemerella anatipestifer]MCU7543069.1 hypothetical protein [Riemerella anatipestifer]MDY3411154.1 hypothetical protein [Riemerella anatipestifer]MDY3441216.1 hypothetical protein [Riemerella anatipestifer]
MLSLTPFSLKQCKEFYNPTPICCFILQLIVVLGYADAASDKTTHLLSEYST